MKILGKRDNSLESQVVLAKGNKHAREQLIKQYTPFIKSILYKATGKYITPQDDEFSIGLMAFNEAIDAYDEMKGLAFLSFCQGVIKRRLIDYYRREKKHQSHLPIEAWEETEDENDLAKRLELKESIGQYITLLNHFMINLDDLVKASPQNKQARKHALEAAKQIADDKELSRYLFKKKSLPLKQLQSTASVSRKTLERHRKYIIAIAVIYIKQLEPLQEYIDGRIEL